MSGRRQRTDYLGQVPLFARLGRSELKKLAGLCIPRNFPEGTLIIEEGSVGLGLFVITAGRVEIFMGSGESRVDLATLEAGGIVGELSVIDDVERSASVRAMTDAECLLLTRDSFQTLLRQDPEIAWCVVPVLTQRVRALQDRVEIAWCVVPVLTQRVRALQDRVLDEQQAGTSAETPGPSEPATETGAEEERAASDSLVKLVRAQYAALMAGVTGVEEAARVGAAFLRRLAQETELEAQGRSSRLARRLPEGLLAASREAWTEGERLPERIVASFLRHLKRDAR
jgi:CRP-like cAMP-binding protein